MDISRPVSDNHFYQEAGSITSGSSNYTDPRGLKIGLISNPLSGGNRKGLQSVELLLSNHKEISHHQVVQPREVKAAVADFASQKINLLVVNGGDGTIHAVLTAIFNTEWPNSFPALALLRSGTTSMIARDVGLPGSHLNSLERLLNWLHTGHSKPVLVKRPILHLEWENGDEPMYGMFFGTGVIYDGIKYCHERIYKKGARGELAAGLTLARFLLAAVKGNKRIVPATPMRIGIEEKAMQDMDIQVLFATTLERLFLGMRPFWGTEKASLHFTAIRPDVTHVLQAAPFLLRGQRSQWATPRHGYFSHNLSQLRLSIQSGFTLDGQLYESDPKQGILLLRNAGEVEFLKL